MDYFSSRGGTSITMTGISLKILCPVPVGSQRAAAISGMAVSGPIYDPETPPSPTSGRYTPHCSWSCEQTVPSPTIRPHAHLEPYDLRINCYLSRHNRTSPLSSSLPPWPLGCLFPFSLISTMPTKISPSPQNKGELITRSSLLEGGPIIYIVEFVGMNSPRSLRRDLDANPHISPVHQDVSSKLEGPLGLDHPFLTHPSHQPNRRAHRLRSLWGFSSCDRAGYSHRMCPTTTSSLLCPRYCNSP